MTVFGAIRASTMRHVLAEGPVWVATDSMVLWIDVEQGTVFSGRLVDRRVEPLRQLDFAGRVGAVVPGDDGSILVAAHDRLVRVARDGRRSEGPLLLAPGADSRSNDGGCDPAGRFLVGTLALDDRVNKERLVRLEFDGSLTVIDADLTLSNGLAWSPDGGLLFSTDTAAGIVWVRDYDPVSGRFGDRRQHLKIMVGFPDGICVDARGCLWVAIWGEGEVRSFLPDGTPGDIVSVDAPHVSSVAFVGDRLDLLLITTASRDLDEGQRLKYPGAGCLFLADVGVCGVPTTAWAASRTRF